MKKIAFIFVAAFAFSSCQKQDPKVVEKKAWVRGNCEMCKERIESNVSKVEGVKSALWDVKSKELTVKYDSTLTNLGALESVCANVGHATKNKNSEASVIDTLPMCCKPGKMH